VPHRSGAVFFAMTRFLFLIFWLNVSLQLGAQESTYNQVLDDDIRTVQVNPDAPYPVVELKSGHIVVTFDHLGHDLKNYLYSIVHCNADWQPSELGTDEYIDGYAEDRLLNSAPGDPTNFSSISNSLNTLMPYTHYALTLPNRNMRWTKSGNYVLKIMDDDDDQRVVIIRRFMVMENRWKVSTSMTQVADASKLFTHQELDFEVSHDGFNVANAQREVKAFVFQNMRWDNYLGPVAPRPFVGTRPNSLNFDYQDSIVFAAGKEWRFLDIRTFEFRSLQVRSIERDDETYQVFLKPEYDRSANHSYGLVDDLNGRFFIDNTTPGQDRRQCEYAKVLFTLERNAPFEGQDVYIFGELSDWLLRPELKMEYSPEAGGYFCNALLKQGFYNYEYLVVDRNTWMPDADGGVEGNWHETGNRYNIFVYYRPFGERYDRLMAVGGADSRIRK
jgi:hypothetical protein